MTDLVRRSCRLLLTLSCLGGMTLAQDGAPPITPGTTEVKMAPGEVRRFAYAPTLSGQVSLWVVAGREDPTLTLLNLALEPVHSDDDLGGERTAHFVLAVKPEDRWTLEIALKASSAREEAVTVRIGVVETLIRDRTTRIADVRSLRESTEEIGATLELDRSNGFMIRLILHS